VCKCVCVCVKDRHQQARAGPSDVVAAFEKRVAILRDVLEV
jgi:hypothetical protein